jgi:HEPN domain-containing protein
MKRPIDLARRFLALADRDIKTVTLLAGIPESDDEAIGFHPQQAVEKCIKAVLALQEVPFRKTHDLAEVVDLLHDHGIRRPPDAETLEALSPFAVTFRYDFVEVETIDREKLQEIVRRVRHWAEEHCVEPQKLDSP